MKTDEKRLSLVSTIMNDLELHRWRSAFAGETYYYGDEPGPVARRAVRYHRPLMPRGGTALDAGSGEGQDVAFLAACGYEVTGVDFTPEGVEKTRRLVIPSSQTTIVRANLRDWVPPRRYDLVIAVNVLQFLGPDAPNVLRKLQNATAPGGVFGFSAFAREADEPALQGTVYRWTPDELMRAFDQPRLARWQPLETARLWQWRSDGTSQPFVTLIARRSESEE